MTPRSSIPGCWTVLAAGLLSLAPVAGAQAEERDTLESWLVERWTTADGLPQNSITDIAQTTDGYLWFSTFGGLARFDGHGFQVFDIGNTPAFSENRLTALCAGPDGELWIGAEQGELVEYSGGSFRRLAASNRQSVWDLQVDASGVLWVQRGGNVLRWVEGELRHVSDSAGWNIVTRADGTVLIPNGRGMTLWAEGESTPIPLEGTDSWRVAEAADGRLWVLGGGFIGTVELGEEPSIQQPHTLARIFASASDPEGALWIGGAGGFAILQPGPSEDPMAGMKLKRVALPGSARDGRSLFLDHEGGFWAGTDGGGLYRLQPHPRVRRLEHVADHLEGDGGLGVLLTGSNRLTLRVASVDAEPETLRTSGWWRGLVDDQGGFWRTQGGRLSHMLLSDPSTLGPVPLPDGVRDVSGLWMDPEGTLWVGGREVLAALSESTWTLYPMGGIGQVHVVRAGLRGELWLLGSTGIGRFTPNGHRVWTPDDGLPRGVLRGLLPASDGSLWVSSYGGGLARIQDEGVFVFTRDQGLREHALGGILEDDDGRLWVNGNAGVQVLRLSDLHDCADGRIDAVPSRVLDTGEGNRHAAHRSPDGRMWFPTVEGVVVLDPSRYRGNRVPPSVVIQRLRANGEPYLQPDGDQVEGQRRDRIRVPPGPGNLEIAYAGLSYTAPKQVVYRYRMSGASDEWIEAGNHRVASFTGLGPGDYTFEVHARNEDGIWSQEPAVLRLTLAPRFYQTLWFRAAVAAAFGLLLVGFHLWRTSLLERHNADLARAEARHHSVLIGSTDPLVVTDPTGRIRLVSHSVARVFGYGDELIGQHLSRLLPELEAAGEGRVAFDDLVGGVREMAGRRSDGGEVPCEVHVFEVETPGEARTQRTAVLRDLTERRRMEQALQESTRMEAVGRLAAGIAHDFNNVLTSILTNATYLQRDPVLEGSGGARDQVDEIRESGQRAAALTRQLLAFSRQQILRPRVLDPDEVVAGLEPMLRRLIPEPVRLNFVPGGSGAAVRADPGQLEQVLMNLVLNARDAMPAGGTLTVETRSVTLDEEYVAQHPGARTGPHVAIAVTDTGVGIDRGDLGRIFEPFYSTKGAAGTGLGLASTQGIVKQSGGHIVVYSEREHGSVFKVYLPQVDEAPDVLVARPAPLEDVRGDEMVLVCDDYGAARASVQRVLRGYGYRVQVAERPLEALQIARDLGEGLDLLVTDVVMPEMNGVELARSIQVGCPQLRVLYMSGYTTNVVMDRGTLKGGVELLEKPFTSEELLQRVRRILDRDRD